MRDLRDDRHRHHLGRDRATSSSGPCTPSSAAQTVSRIVDVFPTDQQPQVRTQLASTIVGVVSQVLLPRTDGTGRVAACELDDGQRRRPQQHPGRQGRGHLPDARRPRPAEGMQTMDQSLDQALPRGHRLTTRPPSPIFTKSRPTRRSRPCAARADAGPGPRGRRRAPMKYLVIPALLLALAFLPPGSARRTASGADARRRRSSTSRRPSRRTGTIPRTDLP
ncbi:MAG: type IV pilus twitching motility protein PilT [Candidatus Moduliflexus flocculans]|nr:type IV pilus twitching motility protein PilT [Candidatus Moduliflexus flocculans]